MRTMRSSIIALSSLFITLLRPVSAQSFLPTSSSSQFPGCAVGCTVLLQAQAACIPQNVPVTNELTYENCFCQNSLVQAIYTTPDSVCAAECTIESDRNLLQTWFKGFCVQVGQGIDPATAATTQATVTVVTVTSTSSPAATATSSSTGSTSASSVPSHKTWIDSHWQWVLMLVILAVGLPLLAWLFVCLKRRHRKKAEDRRAAASGFPTTDEKRAGARSATPELWGPHQHMHHTQGWEYHNDPAVLGGRATASSSKRERKLKRGSSSRKQRNHPEMTESSGSRVSSRPPASRQASSKGKTRAADEIMPIPPPGSHIPADSSRSRSLRDPDSDLERNEGGDPQHQRRLREVRGSRRRRDDLR